MGFNATTAVMFKQCGIYDEFLAIAKPMSGVQVGNIHRTIDYKIDFSEQEELQVSSTLLLTKRLKKRPSVLFNRHYLCRLTCTPRLFLSLSC
jgi:hypothetical protein